MADRNEASMDKYEELFGESELPIEETDPELAAIARNFVYGDIYQRDILDDRTRSLISLACLTAIGEYEQVAMHTVAGLNAGLEPEEIKEAVYHVAPYAGLPKAVNAIEYVNEVFDGCGVEMPLAPQGAVDDDSRLQAGIDAQSAIFGADHITAMREKAPEDEKFIQDVLSAWCFGDFYTRGSLDLKTRELLTVVAVWSLGGTEPQVKAHIAGNLAVGNDRQTLIEALTVCIPYLGFPRSLNALSCIDEVAKLQDEGAE